MKKRGDATRPPYPKIVRWWPKLRAYIAGRRDARAQLTGFRTACALHPVTGGRLTQRVDRCRALAVQEDRADHHGTATSAEAVSDTRRILPRIEEQLAEVEGALGTADPVRRQPGERERAAAEPKAARAGPCLHERSTAGPTRLRASDVGGVGEGRCRGVGDAVPHAPRQLAPASPAKAARRWARFRHSSLLPWTVGDLPLTFPVIETEAGDVVWLATSAPAEGAIPA